MSLREKGTTQNIEDSEDENESGACGGNDPPSSLTAAEAIFRSSYLDQSVDNLSMEVHLGDENSRHPSEISSISYQNLLEDSEPSNSLRSRRGSDDSAESYPLEFPDAELPPDDMETFEACDLPLSEHFPMGSLQEKDHNQKLRPVSSSDAIHNSRPNVKLKDDNINLHENKTDVISSNSINNTMAEVTKKRNSLEIRNNIPTVGEVKDYDKQLNLDLNKMPGAKPKMIGLNLKQSPGLARRVDEDDVASIDRSDNCAHPAMQGQIDVCSLPSARGYATEKPMSNASNPRTTSDSAVEVITPIPKNMNIENEYDYVKYARVQQGSSYVGMRLAYSSSNDSLNNKNAVGSVDSSRETSPEKVLQQRLSDLGQSKVNEETLTEIPLNNSDYSEDKKAFTLSPENTECDSVEVESVTSEGENSPAGFPTVEDGLSSSQASDCEEGFGDRRPGDRSPSKVLQDKHKASIDQQLGEDSEEYQGPPEMDAQAIMEDLKMKREALDMAIADIKTALQRSKSVSTDTPYTDKEPSEDVPIWIKRDGPGQAVKQHENQNRSNADFKQNSQGTSSGKSTQERETDGIEVNLSDTSCRDEKVDNENNDKQIMSKDTMIKEENCQESMDLSINNNTIDDTNNNNHDKSLDKPQTEKCDNRSKNDPVLCKQEMKESNEETEGETNRNLFSVNSAIALVSSNIIENLGSVQNKHVEEENNCEKQAVKEEILTPSSVVNVLGENKDFDVRMFDTRLAQDLIDEKESNNNVIPVSEKLQDSLGDCDNIETIKELNEEGEEVEYVEEEVFTCVQKFLQVPNVVVNQGMDSFDMQEDVTVSTCGNTYDSNCAVDAATDNARQDTGSCGEESDDEVEGSHTKDPSQVVMDGKPIGYDSDDECEDAGGIQYTRRNKGKKYAPLQKDDSLEFGNHSRPKDLPVSRPNGHAMNHSSKNGSVCNNHSGPSYEEHPLHRSDHTLSSEESSDIDAHISSYTRPPNADSDTDEETDRLLQKQYQQRDKHVEIPELNNASTVDSSQRDRHSKAKEVLIEGVLFRARYLGSTQLISEGQPSKAMRMMQAQEAVGRIKAPDGENQPSTDVDLFVSTEKIMVLNTDLQEIMMDHSLRTISYIADIGDILVIMARRRLITSPDDILGRRRRQAKILCHVFESDEAQLIAQSIGQAFQVAYLEFLKANGIEDPGLLKEMDYQDVLNQQEIYGEELNLFANKDFHKEVIVPKAKNEPLGIVIVESGWGSMVPTVVLANMMPTGPAARCGQLNIGDQIISINGVSLVGLLLSACQTYIKASRTQTVVKLTVVPCAPVVEVLIKRPDVKYQLGFSVQNGVICSLLRGGIAERGGVRVGHRIIEINNQSVVAVPHEKIVTLLASSVGEIHMKTMPTSIFRLLTGQDVPHYL